MRCEERRRPDESRATSRATSFRTRVMPNPVSGHAEHHARHPEVVVPLARPSRIRSRRPSLAQLGLRRQVIHIDGVSSMVAGRPLLALGEAEVGDRLERGGDEGRSPRVAASRDGTSSSVNTARSPSRPCCRASFRIARTTPESLARRGERCARHSRDHGHHQQGHEGGGQDRRPAAAGRCAACSTSRHRLRARSRRSDRPSGTRSNSSSGITR